MITAVIPTLGRRPNELRRAVDHLRSYPFDDIIVAQDEGKRLYTRYIQPVRSEYIYTQDDDHIVHNFTELIEMRKPDRIVANMKPHFQAKYNTISDGNICLVGFGAVFPRTFVEDFDRYLAKFPEDALFHREADRVFTWLHDKELIVGDIEDFETSWHGMSHDGEHENTLARIIERLKTL